MDCLDCTSAPPGSQIVPATDKRTSSVRLEKNLAFALGQSNRAQKGFQAGSGDALTLVRLEHRAVCGTNESTFGIGQKSIRGPIQFAALVWADIQPGARLPVIPCSNQVHGRASRTDLQFTELSFLQSVGLAQELEAAQGVFLYMNNQWQRFYQPPTSPLARFGLVLLGIGVLALSFLLGLFFLAIAVGLAVIGGIVLTVRRWLGLGQARTPDDGLIDAEYRVIDRKKSDRRG